MFKLFTNATFGAQVTTHISNVAHQSDKSVTLETFCNQKFQEIVIFELELESRDEAFIITQLVDGKTNFHPFQTQEISSRVVHVIVIVGFIHAYE